MTPEPRPNPDQDGATTEPGSGPALFLITTCGGLAWFALFVALLLR